MNPGKTAAGKLVVVEGIDGSGKSTLARSLAAKVESAGFPITLSREPTDGPFGRKIRATAVSGRLSPEDELALFVEDRREHVRDLVRPRLAAGHVVIIDRYYFSSAAYQGARGLNWRRILWENELFAPEPDLLLMLHLDVSRSRDRISHRGQAADLFESAEYLTRVQAVFDAMEKPYLRRMDASEPASQVLDKAWGFVKGLLPDGLALALSAGKN